MNRDFNQSMPTTEIGGKIFFKIENINEFPPFFMSILSGENHWMFIGSNGGISAGRQNAQSALFPYYTSDKILESHDVTGSKTIIRVGGDVSTNWEPFSSRPFLRHDITQNLYKGIYGEAVLFEEVNHDLQLVFRYRWETSAKYGFVRTSTLENLSKKTQRIEFVDGIQNILPQGLGSEMQLRYSNLGDAYKWNQLGSSAGLGIYALSAQIVDRAEPRESLRANIAWSLGIDNCSYLISSRQLPAFRKGVSIQGETDEKAEKGAFFVSKSIEMKASSQEEWQIVADVNLSQRSVSEIIHALESNPSIQEEVNADIDKSATDLIKLSAAADALQQSDDSNTDARHFANVLFNIMRGGIFDENYTVDRDDFASFVQHSNKRVYERYSDKIHSLPPQLDVFTLRASFEYSDDADLIRLSTEYLPLKFSRRHGDPSRPWNIFSINTKDEDGNKVLDYEGNWRDIFQNWEALAHSYPEFIEGMIFKFLNASTFDGYNPYRVTKDGFDWETIEPDDPWSYIGYWGDHQIIYLLKFLEFIEQYKPGKLQDYFDKEVFVYANIPYKIKSYRHILKNPKDTIDFDEELDKSIRKYRESLGSDGALLQDEKQQIHHVNFIEKILATVLAKVSNLIPGGGIWMNTQRPEWNDANNALVGNGISMVTLSYLHRFLSFFEKLLVKHMMPSERIYISSELMDFYKGLRQVLLDNEHLLTKELSAEHRLRIVDRLQNVASDYRSHVYDQGFWGKKRSISVAGLKDFCRVSKVYTKHAIRANKREDNMYHAYNLLDKDAKGLSIDHLDVMLEGQVAILSAHVLSSEQVVSLLDSMRSSALYRPDQESYILYPNKELKGFLARNIIPKEAVNNSLLLKEHRDKGITSIIVEDAHGNCRFNSNFAHGPDLAEALEDLEWIDFKGLINEEKKKILDIYEEVFNHQAFTGRSGTFFGYEGLGSIYWHMVSKLLLAVQECCFKAIERGEKQELVDRLVEHYYAIQQGIGARKAPKIYGAFPTDPYSHTPAGRGAQQPGMTGQVKEDVIVKWGELGVVVKEGLLSFMPRILRQSLFLKSAGHFDFYNVKGESVSLELSPKSLAFTFCQVPIVYSIGKSSVIDVQSEGKSHRIEGESLDSSWTEKVFARRGDIEQIHVQVDEKFLL